MGVATTVKGFPANAGRARRPACAVVAGDRLPDLPASSTSGRRAWPTRWPGAASQPADGSAVMLPNGIPFVECDGRRPPSSAVAGRDRSTGICGPTRWRGSSTTPVAAALVTADGACAARSRRWPASGPSRCSGTATTTRPRCRRRRDGPVLLRSGRPRGRCSTRRVRRAARRASCTRRSTRRSGFEGAQKRLTMLWGFGPDDVHLVVGPIYHTMPEAYASAAPLRRRHRRADAEVRTRRNASRLVAAELRDEQEHGAGALHPHPRGARRRARGAAILVEPAEGAPRRRAVPGAGEARDHGVVPGAEVWEYYGASEGGGTRMSSAEWLEHRAASAGRSPAPGSHPRRRRGELPPGEVGTLWVNPADRASSTTTTPRRRPRRAATAPSPSATSATWTRTATCTSPIVRATW